MKKSVGARTDISGKGLRIGLIVSRFNYEISDKLLRGAQKTLESKGVRGIEVTWVPGAFEIPVMLKALARRKKFHAFIALGAIIRGATPHFEYVCDGTTRGVMNFMMETGIPVAFGVLTTDDVEQALERAGGREGNKGSEAALVAIEMARLVRHGRP